MLVATAQESIKGRPWKTCSQTRMPCSREFAMDRSHPFRTFARFALASTSSIKQMALSSASERAQQIMVSLKESLRCLSIRLKGSLCGLAV